MNKPSVNRSSGNEQDGRREALVEQAKHAAGHVASDLKEQARDRASTQFESGKEKAVGAMDTVASAIRDTSDKLKGAGPLGRVAEQAAERIERAADFFEGKQLSDLVREAEGFARREPAIFLGATFALGLVAGRFLKSSAPRADVQSDIGDFDDYAPSDEGILSDEALEADMDLYLDDEGDGGNV